MHSSTIRPEIVYEESPLSPPRKKCTRHNICVWIVLLLGFMSYTIIFGKAISYINYNDGSSYSWPPTGSSLHQS